MDDEEEVAFEFEDDPLAEPSQCDDLLTGELGRCRFNGTQDKRIGEPDLIERMAEHARFQSFYINGHIGKFRHDPFIIGRMRTFRILFAGWVIGAAVIVLLTLLQPRAKALEAEPGPPAPSDVTAPPVAPLPVFRGPIIIPVSGITPTDLRDNYLQLRGGGTRTHGAIDIMAPRGTPVVAAVDGTIRKLFTSAGGGLSIYQFDQREERVYYYAHLDRYDPLVHEGLFVSRGTVIGYVGTTGNAAPDAPHLHFAIEVLPPTKEWWKGTPENPYPVLVSAASSARP